MTLKKFIEDVIMTVTWLVYNLQTRHAMRNRLESQILNILQHLNFVRLLEMEK